MLCIAMLLSFYSIVKKKKPQTLRDISFLHRSLIVYERERDVVSC